MPSLTLKLVKCFELELICSDENVLNDLMEFLRTEKTVTRRIELPTGRLIFKEETREVKLYRKNKNKLRIHYGLLDYLSLFISKLCAKYDLELEFDRVPVDPIVISEKWTTIFSNHPKGIERGQMQIDDFAKLSKRATGIAELFTGYGKTELLLALADCAGRRTVILVPDNGIRDEILSRAKAYGVDVANYDWSKEINVINVAGFMRSKNLNDQAKAWLKNVKVSLSDECHHSSSASYQDFFDLMESLERSHGFSASTDVADGKKIQANSVDIRELGPDPALVVSLCGPVRVSRISKIPVTIRLVTSMIADKSAVAAETNWSTKLDESIISEKMSKVVSSIFDIDKDKTFFIPIHKKESGEVLYHNLIEAGHTGILWVSGTFLVNGQPIKAPNILVYLKDLMKRESFRFVMSTKLEGIDLPSLDAVIPLVGANYRMVVQPLGRSARGADIIIYLIYDRNNPITTSQANKRLERIEAEYNIVSKKRIYI